MAQTNYRPYNLHSVPVEAHFATLSLDDLRKLQAKRETEEQKVDLSPEAAFMVDDKKNLDKLITAVVVDTVNAHKKQGKKGK